MAMIVSMIMIMTAVMTVNVTVRALSAGRHLASGALPDHLPLLLGLARGGQHSDLSLHVTLTMTMAMIVSMIMIMAAVVTVKVTVRALSSGRHLAPGALPAHLGPGVLPLQPGPRRNILMLSRSTQYDELCGDNNDRSPVTSHLHPSPGGRPLHSREPLTGGLSLEAALHHLSAGGSLLRWRFPAVILSHLCCRDVHVVSLTVRQSLRSQD